MFAKKFEIDLSTAIGLMFFLVTAYALLVTEKQDRLLADARAREASIEYIDFHVGQSLGISPADFECLKKNIYFESRNQETVGMYAVAFVTVNRLNLGFSDTICGVVFQGKKDKNGIIIKYRCQFSWTCDGKGDTPRLRNQEEIDAWNLAEKVADDVIRGTVENTMQNVTHYHADYVSPHWAKSQKMEMVLTVGEHIFYSDISKTNRG